MRHVVTGLSEMTIGGVIGLAKLVHTRLTGNPQVPTPNPSLVQLRTLIDEAESRDNAYELQKAVLRARKTERDEAVRALSDALRAEAVTVQNATGGDPEKILTTGFAVKALPTRVGLPERVMELRLDAGPKEGTLKASWKRVRGVKVYELQTATDPSAPENWVFRGTATKTKAILNSFASGSRVWVRVRAIGAAGEGGWSDPAVKTVP